MKILFGLLHACAFVVFVFGALMIYMVILIYLDPPAAFTAGHWARKLIGYISVIGLVLSYTTVVVIYIRQMKKKSP